MSDSNDTSELLCTRAVDAPLWKNLIFLKSGRTLFGYHTFTSATNAAAAIPPSEAMMRAWLLISPDIQVVERRTGRHLYFVKEYSHAVPVPWSCDQ